LSELEAGLIEAAAPAPLRAHVAVKLARSKLAIRALPGPAHVSVVFAVYRERARMQRPQEHEHGEDCIVRKVEQLRWLLDGTGVTWELLIVDDGCPEQSGELARRIVAERCPEAPVRVAFLQEAIAGGAAVTRPMASAAESQKGGAVLYGMWLATQDRHPGHVVVFTDADLSTHLGQTGLLMAPILAEGCAAAIGSRREPSSVVVKTGHRNTRGKLFIYLWKGLLAPLHEITDTQCGFKGFSAETVVEGGVDLLERRFAFDIELLLRSELRDPGAIRRVPIAWIDSEAASTTTDLEPYRPMLAAAAAMYREYLPADAEADRLAAMIEGISEEQWRRLSENIPAAIADGDPLRFGAFRPVTVDELASAMGPATSS
jgi:hypothetical protein